MLTLKQILLLKPCESGVIPTVNGVHQKTYSSISDILADNDTTCMNSQFSITDTLNYSGPLSALWMLNIIPRLKYQEVSINIINSLLLLLLGDSSVASEVLAKLSSCKEDYDVAKALLNDSEIAAQTSPTIYSIIKLCTYHLLGKRKATLALIAEMVMQQLPAEKHDVFNESITLHLQSFLENNTENIS